MFDLTILLNLILHRSNGLELCKNNRQIDDQIDFLLDQNIDFWTSFSKNEKTLYERSSFRKNFKWSEIVTSKLDAHLRIRADKADSIQFSSNRFRRPLSISNFQNSKRNTSLVFRI